MGKVISKNKINENKCFSPLLDKDKLLTSLFKISSFLSAPSKLEEILEKILDEVVDTIGFDRGIIRLFDDTSKYLETKVVKNYSPEDKKRAFAVALDIYKHDCVSTKVAKSGEPLAIENVETDPRITDTDRMLTKMYESGSIICAPLKIGEEVIGIIAAWCKKKTTFFPEEINLFLTFANQVGIIIHNARLFQTNAEKIQQLLMLQEAVSEINQSRVLDNKILYILSQSAMKIAKAAKVFIYFKDIEKDRSLVAEGGKVFIDDKKLYDEKITQSIVKQAIDTNSIVAIRGDLDDTSPSTIPLYPRYKSEIAFPLYIKNKFVGALYLAKHSGAYSQDQINILDVLVKNAVTSYDNAIMHSMISLEAKTLKTQVEKLIEREDILLGFYDMIGKSDKMMSVFKIVEEVARHNTNILIHGESGTGKELIARAIHRHSNRQSKPFVDINCAAIPGNLLESELFGYEAGAFTDARKRKIGLLEYANGGTMLLDEIGDMNMQLQVKFLRMLENGYIRRLGSNENIPIDVRFIFSTNKDLIQLVSEGLFREDLYYRISVVPVVIPPLRERGDDIILLAKHYVEEFNKKFGKKVKGFTKEAENIIKSYKWPGNVRELKNIIERVMISQNVGNIISAENIPAEINTIKNNRHLKIEINDLEQLFSEHLDYNSVLRKIIDDIKEKILESALALSGGNKTMAAKQLSISRFKLMREQKKISRH